MTEPKAIPQQEEEQKLWLLDHVKIPSSPTGGDFSLSALTKLELANLGLTELPSCLPEICPSLSILFCPKNNFVEVPPLIGKCQHLQMVSFKECQTIRSIHPQALQPQLRWLILTGNQISEIPNTIGRCTRMQKLMLSGNKLEKLPSFEIWSKLANLELIRLACNKLTEPPVQLLEACPNLRWAAFAGNPFLKSETSSSLENSEPKNNSLPILEDPVLEKESWPILGKGAGGVTRKVPWNGRWVAVKTFAGELTSDGSPQDEKAISKLITATGDDESLIQLLGETKQHGALVMEFLDGYAALAGPPNFETCSQDVYGEACKTNLEGFPLWKIATDTLRVLSKLHFLGVSHSDFYAHNILIQPKNNTTTTNNNYLVKVSDFGAAFRYKDKEGNKNKSNKFARLVETIEVRAYAVLVEELYDLLLDKTNGSCQQSSSSSPPWKELLEECQSPSARFEELAKKYCYQDQNL